MLTANARRPIKIRSAPVLFHPVRGDAHRNRFDQIAIRIQAKRNGNFNGCIGGHNGSPNRFASVTAIDKSHSLLG
jgi:hypothetical protein